MPCSCSRSPSDARLQAGVAPTSQEVAPWLAVIERLCDGREFEAVHRGALAEARRWHGKTLAERDEELLLGVHAS